MDHLMTVTASTKRPPAIVAGLRGIAVVKLATLKCMPLDPVTAQQRETLFRNVLDTPYMLKQTVVSGSLDIADGDILVIGTHEYPIKAIQDWAASSVSGDAPYKLLVVEDLE